MFTFQNTTYSSMKELINGMYNTIMSLLKGDDCVWNNDSLLSIYRDCEESYEKPSDYEEDIEWKQTWKMNSEKALGLAKQTVEYVLSYNEYKEALSVFYGNDSEYDIRFILKDAKIIKRVSEMVELIDTNHLYFQEPDFDIDTAL